MLTRERWRDAATRELIARRYLGAEERAEYAGKNPRAQRQWLLGRIAVKDAVRRWLWDRGAGPVYPVQIRVRNAAGGRPLVDGPFDGPLPVSLAHTGTVAAALVGDVGGPGVGIDVEQVADRGAAFEAAALSAAERDLLDRLGGDRDAWLARFWTAREAAAKAAGTGLAGRPAAFAVERVSGERLLVGGSWVRTLLFDGHAAAWTIAPSTPDPAPDHEGIPDGV
jgi:phosphopantetheinyl transferase